MSVGVGLFLPKRIDTYVHVHNCGWVGQNFHLTVMYKNRHVVHVLMCASPCIQYYFGAGKCLRDSFPEDPYLQGFVFIYL